MGNIIQNNNQIFTILARDYIDAKPALLFDNPFQLLIAVVLSAQTTDERVNIVTGKLFQKYGTPQLLANADVSLVEDCIKTCGLYKNKAKNIIALSKRLIDESDGKVPADREYLESLPGVGRKTASVVLAVAFNIPAFAVDTHVFRVSRRLGLASGDTVLEVEREVCEIIPEKDWAKAHHWLIFHGRQICKAKKPLCRQCNLYELCSFDERQAYYENC